MKENSCHGCGKRVTTLATITLGWIRTIDFKLEMGYHFNILCMRIKLRHWQIWGGGFKVGMCIHSVPLIQA